MRTRIFLVVWLVCLSASTSRATIFSNVRGVIHDPQHRPVEGAEVTIRAQGSDWTKTAQSDPNGEFQFMAVSLGEYVVTVSRPGFESFEQHVTVQSGNTPVLHFPLRLAEVKQTVEVTEGPETISPDSSASESMVGRSEISRTPGADRTNSLAMITDFVPGAYMAHDQLHIRGGHQVSWLVDGVPVPNTMIASNVGPQFDPKDIDYIEVQRGGYSAEYGDRTYGVFNVIPRSGFERNNEVDLALSYGSHNETNDQLSFGNHTSRFAYTASISGNRTDLGLQTPTAQVLHDLAGGLGAFASLIYNASPADQLRLVVSGRGDRYQVPNAPDDQAVGTRDLQNERDTFVNFSWVHTSNNGTLLILSPFYHFNRAAFEGGAGDMPIRPRDDQRETYAGAKISLVKTTKQHNATIGFYGFVEHSHALFDLRVTDGSAPSLSQELTTNGNLEAVYAEDQYHVSSWLTLNGGARFTHFSGLLSENAVNPRAGAVIHIPRLHWALRGFYGRYYQAPPLSTISGPLLDLAAEQGFGFLPLHGERDEQREVGLTIPLRGWTIDLDHYHTNARNFFDHDVLGNSNIFLPLTIEAARLRGWEATVRSPRLLRHAQFHLAYAHQFAEGTGGVAGGLTDFSPPPNGFFYLDHDQRNTLSTGVEMDFPSKTWAAGNFSYGSGFLEGNGPAHLGSHTSFDVSLGRSWGENISVKLSVLNLTNSRYMLDKSNTFGGTHFNYPREVSVTVRYRFHY
jgi:outer membrane receptor protein involved in Fe transport